MQFDGFAVEKWRAQFTGAIDIEEREGVAMRTDKVVVMVVATRIRKSIPEPLDEDGTMRITRQNRIEHLAILEGDLREQALTMLATGSERGFQETLLGGLETPADANGEIVGGMASYADPGPVDEDEFVVHSTPQPAAIVDGLSPENADLRDAARREEPEYFDVPPIKDDSQPVGTGPVKVHTGNGSSSGDGIKVAPTDFSELAAVGSTSVPANPASAPVGEVISEPRPRKDKDLEAFFNEDIPHVSIDPDNVPLIQQITISEGGVEIVYAEPRDRDIMERTGVQNTRVKHVPIRVVRDQLADLIDSAVEVLDAAARAERDVPETFAR